MSAVPAAMTETRSHPKTWRKYVSARTLQRFGIAACLTVLVTLAVTVWGIGISIRQADFIAYFSAFHLVATGHGGQLYNFQALGRIEAAVTYPLLPRGGVLPYVYPPFLAVALTPLGALPYAAAYLIWALINCALLGVSLLLLQQEAHLRRPGKILFWLAALSFLPMFLAVLHGQPSVLMLALLAVALRAFRSGKDTIAGVSLALLSVKPQYVIPFLLILLVWRRWRAIASFVAAMAALVVLPLPILGPSIVGDYAHTLALAGSWRHQYGYDPQWNHSFAGFTQLLLPLPAATVVTDALALLALGALVWFARRTPSIEAVFGLGVVVALLISPHVLIHDLTLLLVPVAIAIGRRGRDPRPLGFILAAGYFLTLLSLVLISVVPLQFSVVAMVGLGIWLLRPGRPAIEPAGPPAGVIGLTKAVGAGG